MPPFCGVVGGKGAQGMVARCRPGEGREKREKKESGMAPNSIAASQSEDSQLRKA